MPQSHWEVDTLRPNILALDHKRWSCRCARYANAPSAFITLQAVRLLCMNSMMPPHTIVMFMSVSSSLSLWILARNNEMLSVGESSHWSLNSLALDDGDLPILDFLPFYLLGAWLGVTYASKFLLVYRYLLHSRSCNRPRSIFTSISFSLRWLTFWGQEALLRTVQ